MLISQENQKDLTFDEKLHKYYFKGKELESVTTWINRMFKKDFDSEYWSQKKALDLGKTKKEVLQQWEEKRDAGMKLGTEVHKAIEDELNGIKDYILGPEEQIRFELFKAYQRMSFKGCEIVGIEERVFWPPWNLAGTIDLVVKYKGRLFMIDWKTNSELTTKDGFNNLPFPFEGYVENDLSLYSIQLSTYKAILGKWGFNIENLFIVHLGPEGLQSHKCFDLAEDIIEYLK